MTTENSAPNDAHAAAGAIDASPRANGTGAEPAADAAIDAVSATPEAAHEAALAADAAAHAAHDSAQRTASDTANAAADAEPEALPETAHAASLAADAALDRTETTDTTQDDVRACDASEIEGPVVDAAQTATDEATSHEHMLSANATAHPESLGQRLRAAREARGMKLEDAAHAMRLPLSTVQALECDRYDRIGEGIYLRSYLAKYLRLLDLPQVLAERVLSQAAAPPPLITSGTISRPRYLYERYSSSALYLILTAVIIVPAVWLAMRAGFDAGTVQITPLDSTESAAAFAARGNGAAPSNANGTAAGGDDASQAPLVASLAPFPPIKHETETPEAAAPTNAAKPAPPAPAADGVHTLRLTLPEASWVEIVAADGEKLEYGLLPAGTTRTYRSAKSVDVRLGNATGASFEVDGKPQDLAPFKRANVAHFRLGGNEGAISHSGG